MDKMEKIIKNFLKDSFKEVVSVRFTDSSVYLANDEKSIIRKDINIVIDPNNILGGGFGTKKNTHGLYELRRSIFTSLDDTLGLDLTKYGSKWGIKIFLVEINEI